MKLTQVLGVKLKVSLQLSVLFVSVDSHRYVYTRVRKCGRLLLSRKTMPACLRIRCASDEKTGYAKWKLSHGYMPPEVDVAVPEL